MSIVRDASGHRQESNKETRILIGQKQRNAHFDWFIIKVGAFWLADDKDIGILIGWWQKISEM